MVEDFLLGHETHEALGRQCGKTGVGEVHVADVVEHHDHAALPRHVLGALQRELQPLALKDSPGQTHPCGVDEFSPGQEPTPPPQASADGRQCATCNASSRALTASSTSPAPTTTRSGFSGG